jgi:hypothetical protein
MKTTIVTTTINVPAFLTGYVNNIQHYNRKGVDFVVIGDTKTPIETVAFCKSIPQCVYLDVPAQIDYMCRFSELMRHMPFNSVERRNIGMLWAYEKGADLIITLDDDNLSTSQDAVGLHQMAGTYTPLLTYGSSSGWFNVCSFLKEENDIEFYHRGYSQNNRWDKTAFITSQYESNRIIVNAGFWLDDPDVDAITRLERKPVVTGYEPGFPGTIAVAPGTWTPFDCQNTALVREVIPAYFLSPYIGRHSDILASYVIARLAQHFGDAIAFGNPLVLHSRQPHNLWKDLDIEREGMHITDEFCDALKGINLNAKTYHEGFGQIVAGLQSWANHSTKRKILDGMELWHRAFKELQ